MKLGLVKIATDDLWETAVRLMEFSSVTVTRL